MANVTFEVDTSELNKLQVSISRVWGQFEWITARAMTTAAKSAKKAIADEILPDVQGGATPWTRRGLIASFARPGELRSMAGFQYGEGRWSDSAFTRKAGGVSAGRYMGVNAAGGDRKPKSSELQLRRAGLITREQFITPHSRWSRIDGRGNVKGSEYQRMLSRVRALSTEGSNQNAPRGPGSRGRSGRKRGSLDYFVGRVSDGAVSRWQLGSEPAFIAERVGEKPKGGTGKGSKKRGRPQTIGYRRGFVRAFNIVDQPNYERRFPIQSVAMREYRRVFPVEWQKGFETELRRRSR